MGGKRINYRFIKMNWFFVVEFITPNNHLMFLTDSFVKKFDTQTAN